MSGGSLDQGWRLWQIVKCILSSVLVCSWLKGLSNEMLSSTFSETSLRALTYVYYYLIQFYFALLPIKALIYYIAVLGVLLWLLFHHLYLTRASISPAFHEEDRFSCFKRTSIGHLMRQERKLGLELDEVHDGLYFVWQSWYVTSKLCFIIRSHHNTATFCVMSLIGLISTNSLY